MPPPRPSVSRPVSGGEKPLGHQAAGVFLGVWTCFQGGQVPPGDPSGHSVCPHQRSPSMHRPSAPSPRPCAWALPPSPRVWRCPCPHSDGRDSTGRQAQAVRSRAPLTLCCRPSSLRPPRVGAQIAVPTRTFSSPFPRVVPRSRLRRVRCQEGLPASLCPLRLASPGLWVLSPALSTENALGVGRVAWPCPLREACGDDTLPSSSTRSSLSSRGRAWELLCRHHRPRR